MWIWTEEGVGFPESINELWELGVEPESFAGATSVLNH